MGVAFEIIKQDNKYILVRRVSNLILFTANTEAEVRGHFLKMKEVYCRLDTDLKFREREKKHPDKIEDCDRFGN